MVAIKRKVNVYRVCAAAPIQARREMIFIGFKTIGLGELDGVLLCMCAWLYIAHAGDMIIK